MQNFVTTTSVQAPVSSLFAASLVAATALVRIALSIYLTGLVSRRLQNADPFAVKGSFTLEQPENV